MPWWWPDAAGAMDLSDPAQRPSGEMPVRDAAAGDPAPPAPAAMAPGTSLPPQTHVAARLTVTASYLLMAATLLLALFSHLLVGLLCVCVGFLATRWLARGLTTLSAWCGTTRLGGPIDVVAVAAIVIGPVTLVVLGLSQAREYFVDAPQQYRELLDYTARTIFEFRQKLPAELAAYLPAATDDLQRMVAHYLRTQAGSVALAGRAWLNALLFAYVGLIIGGLAAVAPRPSLRLPLAALMHRRIGLFGQAFSQIVAAQFWIAAFNTLLTAIFLLVLLPLWSQKLPYTPALITLTFVAGLIPIVGNLVCNAVITLVGLSVSPLTAAACLIFLILIHKAEYVINAKVVGRRTHMAVWELLAVMFVAEAIFGPAGLVAAPLYYAYAKKELQAARLV